MADYVIINSTAAELTDVNVGGDDVAAHTISANLTLTDAELAAVAALDGVAVMQASATAAEKLDVMSEILNAATLADAVTEMQTVLDATEELTVAELLLTAADEEDAVAMILEVFPDIADSVFDDVAMVVCDPATGITTRSTLDSSGVEAAIEAGKLLIAADVSDENRRKAARTLTSGVLSGVKTSL